MKGKILGIIALLSFLSFTSFGQNSKVTLYGKLTDELGRPVDYATVRAVNADKITYSSTIGTFNFSIDPKRFPTLNLVISLIGKVTVDTTIRAVDYGKPLALRLSSLNLNLNEVQINSTRRANGSSNSSIIFDRQAIEQLQAFSLDDVLKNLPGKLYSPVDLQGAKNLTLRTNSTGNTSLNNSLGTAIVIDGIVQSNNANMQNKSVGKYGMAGSTIDDSKNGRSYDVTFGGVDLRDIPADNIESIEVIQGVAPAQYGDLTDGAVIIKRQAGKSDYQLATRFNGGSTNTSLTKGFKLKGNLGALNTSLNYLISNDDPRDRLKQYSRLGAGLMWTSYFTKGLKNTLSFDFAKKFDDAKQDPDDGREQLTYSKNTRYSLSNRSTWEISGSQVLKRISLSFNGDIANQESYSQFYINNSPRPMANKDTTGIYEGFYIPGNFLAVDHVVGRPINFGSALNVSNEFATGALTHFLTAGVSFSGSSNKGQGVLADPARPRFSNSKSQNERPYNFELLPGIFNSGIFVEDNFKFPVFKRDLSVSAGLRYDSQNGYGNFQPRINANYEIAKDWRLNAAYGISTKSPTLAHRYPSPTYYDIPLINYFTGNVNESLLLVYTEKVVPDNSKLRPSQSAQLEFGLSVKKQHFDSSIFGYYKNNTNGFAGQDVFHPLIVPEYGYTATAGQKPVYFTTGKQIVYAGLKGTEILNTVSSKSYGIEWLFSTRKIRELQTSFSFNSVFNYSHYMNSGYTIRQANDQDILAGKKAWFAFYKAAENKDYNITSRINTDTHIPKLGFVVSFILDMVWQRHNVNLNAYGLPFAYADKDYRYFPIANFNAADPDYGHLLPIGEVEGEGRLPFPYTNLSMRISKEIKKRIRFSINAFNVLNIQHQYYNTVSENRVSYVEPLAVGAEFTVKF
ncbi:MAG: TonB-dependent receptor [Bacteroidota bacterium]